jgi:hypothetical protein
MEVRWECYAPFQMPSRSMLVVQRHLVGPLQARFPRQLYVAFLGIETPQACGGVVDRRAFLISLTARVGQTSAAPYLHELHEVLFTSAG